MNWIPPIFRRKKAITESAALAPVTVPVRPVKRAIGGVVRIRPVRLASSLSSAAMDTNRKILRMYDAAITTNLNQDSPVSLTSSNAEIFTSQIAVRSRARSAERNDGYASGIIWDYMRNIGGPDPFRLEMKAGSEDDNGKFQADVKTNREVMKGWKKYGRPENCTVRKNISRSQLQWTAIASMTRCGGALFRHRGPLNSRPPAPNDKPYTGNKIGYAIQQIEVDRLDQNWSRTKIQSGTGNEIQFGIEVNDDGAPLFYHVLTRHPGDIFMNGAVSKYRERIPAEDIIALWDIQTRPEQFVSISRMAPIVRLLHQIAQFDIAHITAAMTAACKSIWVEKEVPNAPEFVGTHENYFFPGSTDDGYEQAVGAGNIDSFGNGGGQGAQQINVQPGEINDLEWGQKIKQLDAKFPAEAASAFRKDLLRCIAAGAQVWYNQIAQDLESVNFASGRLGEMASRDIAMMSQNHVIDMFVRPHFEMWLKYWLMSNETDIPFSRYQELCEAAVFNGRRWDYTNPMQDVQADILKVEAGLDSRSHVIGESYRGGDAEEVDREQEADREADIRHNLDFTSQDVSKPTIQKGEPGEVKPNPLAEDEVEPAAGADGKKGKGIDLDRLERTAHMLAKSDDGSKDGYVLSGDYENTLEFIANVKRIRAQKARARLAEATRKANEKGH